MHVHEVGELIKLVSEGSVVHPHKMNRVHHRLIDDFQFLKGVATYCQITTEEVQKLRDKAVRGRRLDRI